jgi:hypothetical protein
MQGVLQLRKLGRFGVAGVELDRLVPIALRTLLMGWGADAGLLDELTPKAVEIADTLARQRAERQAEQHAAREAKQSADSETSNDSPGEREEQTREVEDDTTR